MHFQNKLIPLTILCLMLMSALGLEKLEKQLSISEGRKVESLEKKIKAQAKMDYSNYKFYPFAIKDLQEFVIEQQIDKEIKGEITVSWIDSTNNVLKYPSFEKEEKIKLTIFDETLKKSIQERIFHFETGFRFHAEPHHRYRIIFKNLGKKGKMVALTISYVQSTNKKLSDCYNTTVTVKESSQDLKKVQNQIQILTRKSEQRMFENENLYQKVEENILSFSKWAIWEIIVFGVFVFAQIWIIEKQMGNNFSII